MSECCRATALCQLELDMRETAGPDRQQGRILLTDISFVFPIVFYVTAQSANI